MQVTVTVQKWEESERDWGTRPDGYSLHANEKARERFVTAYWAGMPNDAPPEYSRPCGTPYLAMVELTDEEQEVLFAGVGIRRYPHTHREYPGDGGPDGWQQTKKE